MEWWGESLIVGGFKKELEKDGYSIENSLEELCSEGRKDTGQ